MRREQLLVDARHKVIALEKGRGRHLHQVLEAVSVLGEESEVIGRLAPAAGLARAARARGHISLVAKNGVEPGCFAFLIKLDGTVKIAMVRQRQRVHPQLLGARN